MPEPRAAPAKTLQAIPSRGTTRTTSASVMAAVLCGKLAEPLETRDRQLSEWCKPVCESPEEAEALEERVGFSARSRTCHGIEQTGCK